MEVFLCQILLQQQLKHNGSDRLESFVSPLLQWLDAKIDKRLVRTFLLTLRAIVTLRHTKCGLLLSELGDYIISPGKAPAVAKRLSNLRRSPKWSYSLIGRFLKDQSDQEVIRLNQSGQTALVIWDESVVEKSESIALEGRGQRSQDHRLIWDANRGCWRKTGIVVAPVKHPQYDQPLYLVVFRPGKGRSPWYLLTNEAVDSMEDAWRIVFAYARRWQIEMGFRYSKTELAMESPRLWKRENRMKLLMMAAVVYAFLISLLDGRWKPVIESCLRDWCHRTGKRRRNFATPLYRLRSALSRLWLTYSPSPQFTFINLGWLMFLNTARTGCSA